MNVRRGPDGHGGPLKSALLASGTIISTARICLRSAALGAAAAEHSHDLQGLTDAQIAVR